jgi:DNA polymerase I
MDLVELQVRFPGGVWLGDTEYATPLGDPVIPVCVVAFEFFSGRRIEQFFDPAQTYENPLPVGKDSLFIAYAAHADWSCFLSLGWELPAYIIDLHAEFRNEISGRTPPIGRGSFDDRLIGAMDYYGLDRISAAEKKELQERIGRIRLRRKNNRLF